MDRRSFIALVVFLSSVVAILALIAAYLWRPTQEWLLAFDPLGLRIDIDFLFLHFQTDHHLGFSIGFVIEVIRLALIALIVVFLLGYKIDADQIAQERRLLKQAGYIVGSSKAVLRLGAQSTIMDYVTFLWSRLWWLWLAIVVTFVWISSFPLGADNLSPQRYRADHPDMVAGADYSLTESRSATFLPTRKMVPPADIGKKLSAQQSIAPEADRLFSAALSAGKWTQALDHDDPNCAIADGAARSAKCVRRGGGPYTSYVFYSLVIYGMLVLPLIVHFWQLLGAMQRDIAQVANGLCRDVQEASAKKALTLQKSHGYEFRTLTLNFFEPVGWLALMLLIYGVYELWFGRFTITFLGYVFFFVAYVIAFGVLMLGVIVMNDLDRYSRCLAAKAQHPDTSADEAAQLQNEARTMSPEQIMASRKILLPWRLFAVLARVFQKPQKSSPQ